ncbi:MAG: Spy/CpxP family protein refolding chaperone [Burkholderiales bacterium]|nr:Spy/CpxP family protein refolding chaperone [Burkholderiales bacterium]
MKTWIKRSLIGLAAVSALGLGAVAVAHRHHGYPMSEADLARARTHAVERIAGRMDLDAAQRQHLDALADALLAQRKALLAGSEPRAALQALVAGPVFDRAGAEALLMAKTDALRAGAPALIAAFGDFFDSLNAEQQAGLRERLAQGPRQHGRRD